MAGGGVERVPSPGGACWMCGLTAVCGERLPGRRHTVRALCQSHADAVFGLDDPPWKRLDARSQREIADEWLRAMTILAHGGHRPPGELLAEIAAVNQAGTQTVRLMSPLMPGEARDLLLHLAEVDTWTAQDLLAGVTARYGARARTEVAPHHLLCDVAGRDKELFFEVPVADRDGGMRTTADPSVSLIAPTLANNFERHAKRLQLLAHPAQAGGLAAYLGLPRPWEVG